MENRDVHSPKLLPKSPLGGPRIKFTRVVMKINQVFHQAIEVALCLSKLAKFKAFENELAVIVHLPSPQELGCFIDLIYMVPKD